VEFRPIALYFSLARAKACFLVSFDAFFFMYVVNGGFHKLVYICSVDMIKFLFRRCY
jgi:hypothetical protein